MRHNGFIYSIPTGLDYKGGDSSCILFYENLKKNGNLGNLLVSDIIIPIYYGNISPVQRRRLNLLEVAASCSHPFVIKRVRAGCCNFEQVQPTSLNRTIITWL